MDFEPRDAADSPPISVSTSIPLPPRVPNFASSASMRAVRRSIALVASNPTPAQMSVTVPAAPALRLVPKMEAPPSVPPPSMPPTGSTPIRRAA